VSIHVALTHETVYRFDRLVHLSPHVIRLRPAPQTRTPIEAYSLRIEPAEHFINWQQDPFGNFLARVVFPDKTRELRVTVDVVADMTVINPFDFFIDESAEHWPFDYDDDVARDLTPYLAISDEAAPLVDAWIADHAQPVGTTNDFLVMLNQQLQRDIAYRIRMEPGVQSPDETLEKANGSCRDTAWLFVQILRKLGFAARFVSGYLVQLTADIAALDGPTGPDHDFTDLHAWTEVYLPGAGWLGLDPTSGLFAGEGHIPLACTPEPTTAAPISGMTDPCEVSFEFTNHVTRVREDPRVTKPYTDAQWTAIDTLGRSVDAKLDAGDVRLTMGGEPTFVSIDDMEADEWNTVADGPQKRALAANLARRLGRHFAPNGLRHHGQGKWYPGEPLPRWQIEWCWRLDGLAVWGDADLLADPSTAGSQPPEAARSLAEALARELGVHPTLARPVFEDAEYEHWQASLRGDANNTAAAVLSASNETPPAVAWVLPLRWDHHAGWASASWGVRRGRLCLVPGDSPAGLRLPLDQIIRSATEVHDLEADRSPFEPRGPLPDYADVRKGRNDESVDARERSPDADAPAPGAPLTAVVVEVRDGHAHVFLPPVRDVEHALDLIARVEAAARVTTTPVVVEGYPPPRDPRVANLVVTPDPGVIEVNVHPARTWTELTAITTDLYAIAREARLGTEKFMLDGQHGGTGGGNHITIGGATSAESPILRRPDLLRSIITYWQHHPSLSYLFSGRFIGPTSQAPRVDESRPDALAELELAFDVLDETDLTDETDQTDETHDSSGQPLPWLVDRALRNLLVDLTGNTHRSEICIDKLFSPGTERGRLGLVELRGFEMPPHPQMASVQALLVRGLIARFWNDPYRGPLVRWGPLLHGRYLLPHFVAADIADVTDDLSAHGVPFDFAWLAPFLEFRFPRIGEVHIGDTKLTLRQAIEPWLVLGEEVVATTTARFVDSSVERVQIDVEGFVPERHVVTCNGVRVPLQRTDRPGHVVAGVRFRAWQPPNALHPTIGVHAPLVFDLVDTWTGHALGGCTYHVSHPGGRAYDTFPVNANAAASRRASRFWAYGHTPGTMKPAALDVLEATAISDSWIGDTYPGVLDLLRASRP